MKLKKVDIQGFKTFVDRTTLLFNAGITGVVGPNGCGKSNIVDSIRWVLGETNPRLLRGSQMEDVIFNGSETRPPLGMAEVTLTIDNEDGSAPAQYAAVPEIAVTRRVYRDGETEYLINKTPCRLKDITDLFMGTGANFYSVVEQGRITSVVSAKPEDLRVFIEEAAGITFYRSRKRAALRRIEATQHNLVRVSDILSEIGRQIRYLERQAAKAERYRELRDRLRLLELNLGAVELRHLDADLARLDFDKESRRQSLLALESQSESQASQSEELRLELHGLEARVQEAQKKLYEAGKTLAEREKQREFLTRETADLKQRQATLSDDIARNKLKLSMTEEQLAAGIAELADLLEQNSTQHERIAGLEAEHNQSESQLLDKREATAELRASIVAELTKLTSLQHQLASFDQFDASHAQQQDRWQQELHQQQDEKGRAETATHQLQSAKTTLAQQLAEYESRLQQLRAEIDGNAAEFARLNGELQRSREERTQASSRYESMLALENEADVEQFVNLSRPVVGDGLLGSVSKLIQVPKEYEKAVEAYLGERLNWLVVNDAQKPAEMMWRILDGQNVPRATIVPQTPSAQFNRSQTAIAGTVAMAQAIGCPDSMRGLVDYLCSDTLIVDDLKAAAKAEAARPGVALVTRNGEVVVPGAEVTAGQMGDNYQGILHRKREMEELRNRAETLGVQVTELDAAVRSNQSQRQTLETESAAATEQIQNLRLKRLEIDKDLDRGMSDLRRAEERLKLLEQELLRAGSASDERNEERQTKARELIAAERLHADLKQQESGLHAELEALESALSEAKEAWTQARVESASAFEREEHLNQEKLRLQSELEQTGNTIARMENEQRQLGERADLAAEQHIEVESTLGGLRDDVVAFEAAFQECQRGYQALNARLQAAEMSRREAEGAVHRSTREIAELEFKQRELSTKKQHLINLMIDRWKVDLTAVSPEPIELTEESRTQVDDLRQQMEKMGEVNLGAVEEFAFLKERFDFLSTQKADLEQSLDSLQKTIRKIDSTTQKLFFEAYEGINAELKVMFPRLFGGGKAELMMTGDESMDPLERGMTIIAHPPGKRPQHINLLSGGEKSMTAAALIFAIFKYKPSPFSILDEVDAALDDENTRRLNRIAQEISAISQLVIITHNKRTMEVAQNLYGITMEEPGVSKIVSVKLEDPHHTSQGKPTEPLHDQTQQAAVA